jgi:hypothetical protein
MTSTTAHFINIDPLVTLSFLATPLIYPYSVT